MLSVESDQASVDEQFEDLMTDGSISLTLPQGVSVNFSVEAELEDGHSFVILEYIGFSTRTGEAYVATFPNFIAVSMVWIPELKVLK